MADQVPVTTQLPPIKPEHEVPLDAGGSPVGNMGTNSNNNNELGDVFDRIKTHFPPAKVKKIMQTDEDIGKVSQATPVIAGRSLEFFIALLVKKAGDGKRTRNQENNRRNTKKNNFKRRKIRFLKGRSMRRRRPNTTGGRECLSRTGRCNLV